MKMARAAKQKRVTMDSAESYADWQAAAIAFDDRNGGSKWKQIEKSNQYDYAIIRRRLEALRSSRESGDNQALLFTLNEGIHGNLGGMGKESLYKKAKFGTKQLIVDYVTEVNAALEHLAQPRLRGVSLKEKHDFFQRASLCFGRSAFLMSGSGTYLYFHVGVLKGLHEQGLLPEVISGSSGGSFVAAVVGTRRAQDLSEVFEPEFSDSEATIPSALSRIFLTQHSTMKNDELEATVARLIPDLTFEQAYERSGIHINISITPAEAHQKSRLLNAITSPNVMVREAVMASCAIPGVYSPVTLAAKDVNDERVPYLPDRKWVDGSISDDIPMKRLSRLYGVNHFIVSQTNPFILPFVSAEKSSSGIISTISQTAVKSMKDWGMVAGYLIRKPFSNDSYVRKLVDVYTAVISQTYTGDINILPSSRFLNIPRAITHRTREEIAAMILEGERATWPQIEKVRIQTKVSRTLSRLVKDLDNKILRQTKRSARRRATSKLKVVQTKKS